SITKAADAALRRTRGTRRTISTRRSSTRRRRRVPDPGMARTAHGGDAGGDAAAQTSVVAGSAPITTDRRLDTTTAPAIPATARTATSTRMPVLAPDPMLNWTTAGAISSETRFITLISGFSAGPAVSLNGSPTVSPITVAACG